jgi:hypothetical protein
MTAATALVECFMSPPDLNRLVLSFDELNVV